MICNAPVSLLRLYSLLILLFNDIQFGKYNTQVSFFIIALLCKKCSLL